MAIVSDPRCPSSSSALFLHSLMFQSALRSPHLLLLPCRALVLLRSSPPPPSSSGLLSVFVPKSAFIHGFASSSSSDGFFSFCRGLLLDSASARLGHCLCITAPHRPLTSLLRSVSNFPLPDVRFQRGACLPLLHPPFSSTGLLKLTSDPATRVSVDQCGRS